MASSSSLSLTLTTIAISLMFIFSLIPSHAAPSPPSDSENKTHIHFYFHDVVVSSASAGNTSVVRVIKPLANAASFFGMTMVMDDPLTETKDSASTEVGRAQGIYAGTSQSELSLLMLMNMVFTAGEHKGSTLTVLGRNQVGDDVREMPVVGGTGKFRLARGYALANTIDLDVGTGNAVVEYNVYVRH